MGPDPVGDSLKADIERLMSQAKYEAVVIAERNLARSDISLSHEGTSIYIRCLQRSILFTPFPLSEHKLCISVLEYYRQMNSTFNSCSENAFCEMAAARTSSERSDSSESKIGEAVEVTVG